jgi:hypothetical protein
VPRLKHDEPREHHRGKGQKDGEQAEPRELEAKRRQAMQAGACHEPARQRGPGDRERERDHATSR